MILRGGLRKLMGCWGGGFCFLDSLASSSVTMGGTWL